MKKYLFLILLFSILMSGCARHNRIDFSSSKTFFSSLNETKKVQKKDIRNTAILNSLKKSEINKTNKKLIKKPLLLTLSSYKKKLKQKIGLKN